VGHHLGAGEGAEAAVGRGDHPGPVAHRVHRRADAIGDHLRVLNVVRGGVDHSGQEQHRVRERMGLEHAVLVLVAGIGERQRQRPHPRPADDRQHRFQRHVVGVRAVVVAPTEVESDPVGRDRRGGPVDGVHVQLDHLEEPVERVLAEEAGALHGQVRAVHLQEQAAGVDQLVFLPHLAGQRHDVLLV